MKTRRLEIEYRDAKSLSPYNGNARTHSPAQVDKIVKSIREFGWTNPVLIDGANGVIAGHGRLLAAEKLGLAQVPCIELAGLSEAQKRAYIIADNKTALDAGWDNELLNVEFAALAALDFDLELTGFSLDEIDALGVGDEPKGAGQSGAGSLAEKFMIPPFSVLNAREGWWQDRKRAWLALGIQSELGRGEQLIPNGGGLASKSRYDAGGADMGQPSRDHGTRPQPLSQRQTNATPGGSLMPAADYSKRQRGDGKGRAIGEG